MIAWSRAPVGRRRRSERPQWRTLDRRSISPGATGVDVFRCAAEKDPAQQRLTRSAPNRRSHEVWRISPRENAFRLPCSDGGAQPIPHNLPEQMELRPPARTENGLKGASGGGGATGIGRSPAIDAVDSTQRPSRLRLRRCHLRHHLSDGSATLAASENPQRWPNRPVSTPRSGIRRQVTR